MYITAVKKPNIIEIWPSGHGWKIMWKPLKKWIPWDKKIEYKTNMEARIALYSLKIAMGMT